MLINDLTAPKVVPSIPSPDIHYILVPVTTIEFWRNKGSAE